MQFWLATATISHYESPAGGGGLLQLRSFAPDAGYHQCLAVPSQGVFQHMGQLGGAVWDMISAPHRQGHNDLQTPPGSWLTGALVTCRVALT